MYINNTNVGLRLYTYVCARVAARAPRLAGGMLGAMTVFSVGGRAGAGGGRHYAPSHVSSEGRIDSRAHEGVYIACAS